MDWSRFDDVQFELLSERRFDEAERQLLGLYDEARMRQDLDILEQAISRLAHFYALPLTENFDRARFFFEERERLFPSDYGKLQTALFRFYCLSDPAFTIEKLDEITNRSVTKTSDVETDFTATALRGQCLLKLGRVDDLSDVVDRLAYLADKYPHRITHADAFSLINELVSNRLYDCRTLLDIFLRAPLSPATKEKVISLRREVPLDRVDRTGE